MEDEEGRKNTGESALVMMREQLKELRKLADEGVDDDSLDEHDELDVYTSVSSHNSEDDPLCQRHKNTLQCEELTCLPSFLQDAVKLGGDRAVETVAPKIENEENKTGEQVIENEQRLKELEDKVRWIYETSDSEDLELAGSVEDGKACSELTEDTIESTETLDTGLRDYLMKELLKQGKDWQWYLKGVNEAAEIVEQTNLGEDDTGLKSAVEAARRLSHTISESLKSPYRHSKVRASHIQERGCTRKTKEKLSELRASMFENKTD